MGRLGLFYLNGLDARSSEDYVDFLLGSVSVTGLRDLTATAGTPSLRLDELSVQINDHSFACDREEERSFRRQVVSEAEHFGSYFRASYQEEFRVPIHAAPVSFL